MPDIPDPEASADRTVTQDFSAPGPPGLAGECGFPAIPGYEIVGELGRGGMGVVYQARQVGANRLVALKMIIAGEYASPDIVLRFRTEATAIARLQHPHVVNVYDVSEYAGRPYFSMEYCPAGTLSGNGPAAPQAAAETVSKLARGMAAAHAAGIVHRDLKPANILIGADGEPKIADFGLAKRTTPDGTANGMTRTGAVMGTPSYMAPEQAFGDSKNVGPPADVYALGAILYELLSGRPPFTGPTPVETIMKVIGEDPVPLRRVRADIPRALEAICQKCLEKNPQHRYPSAAALADDLNRYLTGEPISIGQTGIGGRLIGAMDRIQLKEQFSDYGSFLLALAPVMLLPEIATTLLVAVDGPNEAMWAINIARAAAFLLAVGYFRGWEWLPRNAIERQLWAIWGGYLVACFAYGVAARLTVGSSAIEIRTYQSIACMTALAFFTLAPQFWGYCTVIGGGFLTLSLVMAIDLRWAPLEFGTAWAFVLVIIGIRLRQLGRRADVARSTVPAAEPTR